LLDELLFFLSREVGNILLISLRKGDQGKTDTAPTSLYFDKTPAFCRVESFGKWFMDKQVLLSLDWPKLPPTTVPRGFSTY
jgi:hypothetical protein